MSEYDEQPDLAPDQPDAEQAVADEFVDDPATAGGSAGDGWEAPATGVAAVDDVLASVQGLDGRPVEEHVAVFEQAHDRLRRALDPGHG